MKLSLGISACVHVIVLTALVFLFQAVPRMRLPEGVYSVKILQPFVGSGPSSRSKTEDAKKDAVKIEEPKQPKKEEAKVPVPKKPDVKKEGETKKNEAKKETPAADEGEKPLGVTVGAGDGTGMAVDATNFPFGYFLAAIERRVSENWFSAVSEGGTGLTCIVYFKLMRDGGVSDARIETSSGNGYFDRAAVRAVRSAAPFPPLPRAFTDAFLGIHFTFVQKD
jgi:TonB family protein